jgi:adenylyltransferase/sulfurtransferase
MEFTEEQISRYSRHILLPEVGGKGAEEDCSGKNSAGGGRWSGVSCSTLLGGGRGGNNRIDRQRCRGSLQPSTAGAPPHADIGRPKVLSGKEKINALNPDVQVVMHEERLTSKNAREIIGSL